MPNWCSTSYKIVGKETELKKLEEALKEVQNTKNAWEGDVIKLLGDDPKNYDYMRGFITAWWTDEKVWWTSERFIGIDADEAWSPTDFWRALEKILDVKVYYIAEEPGSEIFETNDSLGVAFQDRYVVYDKDGNTIDYLESDEEMESWKKEDPDLIYRKVEIIS